MTEQIIRPAIPLFLRFYARCFAFPYEEMGYELQHMFRQIEREELTDDDYPHLEQVLNIVNNFQGEELKSIRDNYLYLFGRVEGERPVCSCFSEEFTRVVGIRYDADPFINILLESALPIDREEPLDSIIYYLEYLSIRHDTDTESDFPAINRFMDQHILSWIPAFCDRLLQSSQISLYKEVAVGLSELLVNSEEFQSDNS